MHIFYCFACAYNIACEKRAKNKETRSFYIFLHGDANVTLQNFFFVAPSVLKYDHMIGYSIGLEYEKRTRNKIKLKKKNE